MANAVAKKKETSVSTDVMDDILEFAGDGAVSKARRCKYLS